MNSQLEKYARPSAKSQKYPRVVFFFRHIQAAIFNLYSFF